MTSLEAVAMAINANVGGLERASGSSWRTKLEWNLWYCRGWLIITWH